MFSFIKKKLGWGQSQAEPAAQPEAPAQTAPIDAPAPAATKSVAQPAAPSPSPAEPAALAQPDQARPPSAALPSAEPAPAAPTERKSWLDKLRQGLRKTGSSIAQVFTGTQIDDALYEELESALLMADAGVAATEYLLQDLKKRVK